MSGSELGQTVAAVRTPGAAVDVHDCRPIGGDLLKAELTPSLVSETEFWSDRSGPQRSVGCGRHIHGDGRHRIGVQFLWFWQSRLDLGHTRLRWVHDCTP